MFRILLIFLIGFVDIPQAEVFFQAHRGAVDEAPENTLAALKHAWSVPSAVPELDLRTTKDGVIVCLHDTSLAKTTNASLAIKDKNINQIEFEDIKNLDAGSFFHSKYKNEKIPTLLQVFDLMLKFENAQIYLDVKDVDYDYLRQIVTKYNLETRMIFVHGDQVHLIKLKNQFPKARTMTWLSGEPHEIKQKYQSLEMNNFNGIDQLQFHLKTKKDGLKRGYVLDESFLLKARKTLSKYNKDIQIRPFEFNPESMKYLLNLGINWYVTDAPQLFYETIQAAQDIK